MLKKVLVLLAVFVIASSHAQPDSAATREFSLNAETRLTLLENRLARLESDVNRLTPVPTSLARIEEKLNAVIEKSSGWNSNISTVVTGVIMLVIGSMWGTANQTRKHSSSGSNKN